MRNKTSSETTGYDLSTTDTILSINCGRLLHIGVHLTAGSSTDFAVDIQPEGSSNWYTHKTYSAVTNIDDVFRFPAAFNVRLRNTATVADTADAVLGGAE